MHATTLSGDKLAAGFLILDKTEKASQFPERLF